MDELILKQLEGRATDIEARRVEQWRHASAENERAYRETRAVWEIAGLAAPPETATPPPVEVVTTAAEARRRRDVARRRGRRVLRSPWLAYGLAAAAVAALVMAGVERGARAGPENVLAATSSSTMAGDVVTMSLSDGSVVRMASSSHLRFPPGSRGREVDLEGRAFFAVAPGEAPFVVLTDVGSATAHGTRFEVRVEGDALRLVVVEGRVLLEGGGGSAEVGQGQVAFLSRGGTPRVVDREDVWTLLEWPAGLLLFQATPLREVAGEIGRHFGRPVEVDSTVARRRVTAWFEDESLDEVVSAVCLVAGVKCEVRAARVRMTAP